jgi:hypothetical protein
MRENGLLDPAVVADFISADPDVPPPNTLAKATKNYSGAEIAGLVRNAMSHALNRGVSLSNQIHSVYYTYCVFTQRLCSMHVFHRLTPILLLI